MYVHHVYVKIVLVLFQIEYRIGERERERETNEVESCFKIWEVKKKGEKRVVN